ncbi:MAG TPA: hypothetical protein VIH61_01975, partial [Waddliaceae bacterium]
DDLERQIETIEITIQKMEDELSDVMASKNDKDVLKETFPVRTQAMVQTLRMINNLRHQSQINGPIFLMGGEQHLKTATQHIGVDEFCLDSLYKELQSHNAIILIPKTCASH